MRRPEGVCYIDTSALTKFYVKERGSRRLVSWFGPRAHGVGSTARLFVSALGYPEAMSAITRRRNIGTIPSPMALRLWNEISADFSKAAARYSLVEPNEVVIGSAAVLVAQYGLRAYDAVHLASALRVRNELRNSAALTFVSSDARLLAAAKAERLAVADPTV